MPTMLDHLKTYEKIQDNARVSENNYNNSACERVTIETNRSGATINKYSYSLLVS